MLANITEEIELRGCNPNPQILAPSEELVDIAILINEIQNNIIELPRERFRKVLKSSRDFLNSIYDLHYVPFEFYEENFFIKLQIAGDADPFRLPIKRIKDESDFYGCLREFITFDDGPKITYRHIELPKRATKLTSLSYTHEITHTQLNNMRGLIQNYFNTEVLSIFNELLHAYHTNDQESLLRVHDEHRLLELAHCILDLEMFRGTDYKEMKSYLLEGSCYCESTLKAYNMFIRYYFGNSNIRKELISGVQSVIDGDITLEDELKKLDISYENSQDIKSLRKYLNR